MSEGADEQRTAGGAAFAAFVGRVHPNAGWMLTMGQSYGPGVDRFGPISVMVLILLSALVLMAWWVARHPHLVADVRQRARSVTSVQRLLEWAHRRLRSTDWEPVRRFAADGVAAAALLAGLALIGALSFGFTELLEDVLEGDGIAVFDPTISSWLARHRDLWLTTALRVVTALGSPAILATLAIVSGVAASWRSRSWLPAAPTVVAASGAGVQRPKRHDRRLSKSKVTT